MISILPALELFELTFRLPEFITLPFFPASIFIFLPSIVPVFETNLITPFLEINFFFCDELLIVASTKLLAAEDLIKTCPFSDFKEPSFSIKFCKVDSVILILNLPSDEIANFALSPETSAKSDFVLISPLFFTFVEIKAT